MVWIRDYRSGIREKFNPVPNPGTGSRGQKAPDLGSRSTITGKGIGYGIYFYTIIHISV